MPDWLNDPDLRTEITPARTGRRQRREQQHQRQRAQLSQQRRGITSLGFLLTGVAVLIVVYGAANLLPWVASRGPAATAPPAAAPAAPPSDDPPAATATATATAQPSPATTTTPTSPAGRPDRALAASWLTGYLTRVNRDDASWQDAIAPLTTPDLVDQLALAGPDAVGLDQLTRWQVTKIAPYKAVDQPVDTPSRVVLSYAATVTDGHVTRTKPFQLYAYLGGDGRWLIGALDQPYSSEN